MSKQPPCWWGGPKMASEKRSTIDKHGVSSKLTFLNAGFTARASAQSRNLPNL